MARSIVIQILGDASDLKREFRMVENDSDRLGKKLGGNFKKYAKIGAAGAAVGGAALITKQLFDSVSAAKESEKAEFRLGQAFDSAKVKAKDRAKAQAAVNRVSRKAGLDDEELSDTLAKLTRSTGSVTKAQKGMALAAEIARGRDIPLAAAAKIVEQAMLGKERGLAKIGVVVPKVTAMEDKLKAKINVLKESMKKATGAAKEKIKAQIEDLKGQVKMAKQLDKVSTGQAALAKAQKMFAGASEKYGKTAAGAQDKLNVAFENLQERVGAKLLPVLAKLSIWGVRFMDWSEKNWPQFQRTVKDAFDKVRPVIQTAIKYIEGVYNAVKNTVMLVRAIIRGDWSEAWDRAKKIVTEGIFKILDAITTLPRKIVAKLTGAAWGGLKKVGERIRDGIMSGLNSLKDMILNLLQWIVNKVNGVVGPIRGALGKVGIDIPKIPDVVPHQQTGNRTRIVTPGNIQPGTRSSGPRDRGQPFRTPSSAQQLAASGDVNAIVNLDGQEVGRLQLKRQQRTARGTATSRRGPHAGRAIGLG